MSLMAPFLFLLAGEMTLRSCCRLLQDKEVIKQAMNNTDGLREELETAFQTELADFEADAKKKKLRKQDAAAEREKLLLRLASESAAQFSLDKVEPSSTRNIAVCREAAAQFVLHGVCGYKALPGSHSKKGRRYLNLKDMGALLKSLSQAELLAGTPPSVRIAAYTGSCDILLQKYNEHCQKEVERKKRAAESEPAAPTQPSGSGADLGEEEEEPARTVAVAGRARYRRKTAAAPPPAPPPAAPALSAFDGLVLAHKKLVLDMEPLQPSAARAWHVLAKELADRLALLSSVPPGPNQPGSAQGGPN
jgi:hypothetical protein